MQTFIPRILEYIEIMLFCESSVMSKLHWSCAVYSIMIVVVIIIHQDDCTPDIVYKDVTKI